MRCVCLLISKAKIKVPDFCSEFDETARIKAPTSGADRRACERSANGILQTLNLSKPLCKPVQSYIWTMGDKLFKDCIVEMFTSASPEKLLGDNHSPAYVEADEVCSSVENLRVFHPRTSFLVSIR